jgi:hypothetical protein
MTWNGFVRRFGLLGFAGIFVFGGCSGGKEPGGQGSGGTGAASGGAGRGTGGGDPEDAGAGGEAQAGAGGGTTLPDPADLGELEASLVELARIAARAELEDLADPAFSLIDDSRRKSYPEIPTLPKARQRITGAARGPVLVRQGEVGFGVGIAVGQLLLLTQSESDTASFPVSTMQTYEAGGMSANVTIVDNLMRSGSLVTADISAAVVLTLPSGAQLNESILGHAEVETCPDARGEVPLRVSISVNVATETGAMQATYSATTTATVNDEAEVAGMNVSADIDVAAQGSATDVVNTGGEIHIDLQGDKSTVSITRDTPSEVVAGQIRAVGGALTGVLESFMLDSARQVWQGGKCVELVVMGADPSNTVEIASVTGFSAKVRHKIEGTDLDVPVTSTLSGQESLTPNGKAPSPVSYAYTAPAEDMSRATVTLESRSRRGVAAKKEVGFVTAGIKAYEGTLPFSGELRSSSSTLSWAGSLTAKLVRDTVTEGGATYSIGPGSKATFDSASLVYANKSCSLPAPVTTGSAGSLPGGADPVSGVLAVSLREPRVYSISLQAVISDATLRCVDDDGNVTEEPAFLIAYPRTATALGNAGTIPFEDITRFTGSATYGPDLAGLSGETSWDLRAIVE